MSRPITVTTIGTCLLLGVAGSFGIPATAHAATRTVTNCNDSGAGSLRATIATALSGDVINLAGLTCSVIHVTSGQILVLQASLEIVGGGRAKMTLRGTYGTHRVLRHTGTGTLTLRHLSVSYGRLQEPDASGGCVWSAGNVALRAARVHHCAAISNVTNDPTGRGGGVYALGNVLLSDASVFRNLANNSNFGGGGGGVAAEGDVTLQHSQVYENIDSGQGGGIRGRNVSVTYSLVQDNITQDGGGVFASGNLHVNKSTFTGNLAGFEGGAILVQGTGSHNIYDSTISGNEGINGVPGVRTDGFLNIRNSTIVGNVSDNSACGGAINAPRIVMFSTIAANNACIEGGPDEDVGGPPDATLTGSHNLIESSSRPVPFDTINADPMLAPLANNGGPTRTHALMAGSPAIDEGNNVNNRVYDQRGPGFPRVKGSAPDIGAFER